MNALTHPNMFQSAYQQITTAERSFVDWLVHELAEAARRLGQRISLALSRPLPDAVVRRDTHGWLQRPLVRAAINERIRERDEADEISPSSWIREVHGIAHFNIDEILRFDENNEPYFDIAAASHEQLAAIKTIEFERNGDGLSRASKTKIKITAHDKIAALKMEAAYLGLDDGDNPHRRADKAAMLAASIPATASEAAASDAYAQMIGDDA